MLKLEKSSILDFDLFRKETEFYSCFHLREDTRGILYTDKMEFHVIELPKLPKEQKEDCSILELWAKFISAEKKEEFDMVASKNPYIESAYEKLRVISQDREKRIEYEAREKAIRDYNEGLYEAEERGIRIGEQRGEERGIQIGERRGEERVNKLYGLLLQEKRYEDLERSTKDEEFRGQLMSEYGI